MIHAVVSADPVPSRRPLPLTLAVCLLLVLFVGVLDYLTGVEISFSIFYLIPVSLAAWWFDARLAVLIAMLSAVTWLADDAILGGRSYSHPMIPVWNSIVRLGVFVIVAGILSRLKRGLANEHEATRRLTDAYADLDRTRKEQLLLKDQLLSHVSHELRTPLTATHQFLTITLDGLAGPLTEQQREYLQIALRNVNQLERLIRDLVEVARAEAGKLTVEPVPMSLPETVRELVRTLRSPAAEKGISLREECPEDLPLVRADPARVRQVVLNLLDNAIKFTPEGGTIHVQATVAGEEPGFVRVCVSDTGRGMSEEAMRRLFQRLYQEPGGDVASRRGLGLGLYISRELIARHGGRVWAESEPGRGSRFYFTLPVAPPTDTEDPP